MATNVHGEGSYHFEWEMRGPDGKISSRYQQDIYGKNLSAALEQFLEFHGGAWGYDQDPAGETLAITKIEFVTE